MARRRIEIVAQSLRIVYNRFGDHDPNGLMYALKDDASRIQRLVEENPFTPVGEVQPLVLRVHEGDEVEIVLENRLSFHASVHVEGLEYDVASSDGSFVGRNEDSTVPPGESRAYLWYADQSGTYLFHDLGNPLGGEAGSNVHGLFGTLVVEPRGASWTDPVTGAPLASGVHADVHHPFLPSVREHVVLFHDEVEMKDVTGEEPLDPMTRQPESTQTINYRAEPMRNRVRLIEKEVVCPDCEGEEVHHDSWVFGDPATPVLRHYRGDPAKIRLVHGGVKETHVFHLHVHQWLANPRDVDSEIIDSQSLGPQTTFEIDLLYGAGSLQEAYGDAIFHCHLYPHFGQGMWALLRTFDKLEDGSRRYPDGSPTAALRPLPDRPLPPVPTSEQPGWPHFIPGVHGEKAPRPPLAIVGGRQPTSAEEKAFDARAVPGALFVNPCPDGVPVREYNISAIQLPITYNRNGWHDPQGRIFCLTEDEEDIRAGRKPIEPLVIRANAGNCIRFNFTNKLPETLGVTPFQLAARTYEVGMHVHFVKFDPLTSDGANVGWNYDSSVLPGQTIRYQWYADVELKAVFWHDHLFANLHQLHGLFAATIIEPRGSRFLDEGNRHPQAAGPKATISQPFIPDFRELALFVHDFCPLLDRDGNPLNPPPFVGAPKDNGVMAINYRSEPLRFRSGEPAWAFSSYVHGDPETPLLGAYSGDPVRIRLLDGSHEEQHIFNLHRQRWRQERKDLNSEPRQFQGIGVSESFTIEFNVEGDSEDFDMLYHYGGIDDLWLGCWGLVRAFGREVPELKPLADRPLPPKRSLPHPKQRYEVPVAVPPTCREGRQIWPAGVPVRRYDVVALNTDLVYDEAGSHDPHGVLFVLEEEVDRVRSGEKRPEPLVLRANEGDLIEVRLKNALDHEAGHPPDAEHGYPRVPVDQLFPPSERVSLHPQLLAYDVLSSDGATVGFNPDQTVGPGEEIVYRWYAEAPFGTCILSDLGDVRHHRHHGAFGVLVVEPRGSAWSQDSGQTAAIISNSFLPSFKEFVLIIHDGLRLVDAFGRLIVDPEFMFDDHAEVPEESQEEADEQDQGSRAFNYRAAAFRNRVEVFEQVREVFSSREREPSTPLYEARVGMPVTIRLAMPADKPRQHAFTLHGHLWQTDPGDVWSGFTSNVGSIAPGFESDLYLRGGAGGIRGGCGDYMYRAGAHRWHLELGLWGILRVRGDVGDD